MGLKPGYKLTEVGLIPEDWRIDGLGCFWNVIDCKHVTAKFVDNGYPVASIMEVQSRFLDLTGANQTTKRFYNLLIEGGRKPRVGDLILSRNATVGEVAQVAEWHPPFAMGQDVCLLRKGSQEFSTDYLQAVFRSPLVANQLSDLMVGSTFKRVNIQQIRHLLVPMPRAAEQEAIAEALSDVDALIEFLEQLLAKKRQIKQGAMQDLITGKKRLPGFSGEWEVKMLGEVGRFLKGSGVTKGESLGGSIPCVRYGEIYTRHSDHIRTFFSWISRDVAATATQILPGDILFAGSGETKEEIGKCIAFVDDIEAYAGGDIVILRPVNANSLFLGYYLNTESIRRQKASRGQGDAVVHISASALATVETVLPSTPEQTAIAAILSDMDSDIAALEAKLAKARALKQGMMQKLLTGAIRLPLDAHAATA